MESWSLSALSSGFTQNSSSVALVRLISSISSYQLCKSGYSTTYGYCFSISMSLVLNLRIKSLAENSRSTNPCHCLCLRNDGILQCVPTGKPVAKSMLLKLLDIPIHILIWVLSTLAFAVSISGSWSSWGSVGLNAVFELLHIIYECLDGNLLIRKMIPRSTPANDSATSGCAQAPSLPLQFHALQQEL